MVFVCVRLSAECESAQLDTRRVIRNGRGRGGRARVWRAAGGDEPTRIEAQARDDPAEPRGGLRHTRSAAVCSDLVCVLCYQRCCADYRLDYRCIVFFGLALDDREQSREAEATSLIVASRLLPSHVRRRSRVRSHVAVARVGSRDRDRARGGPVSRLACTRVTALSAIS